MNHNHPLPHVHPLATAESTMSAIHRHQAATTHAASTIETTRKTVEVVGPIYAGMMGLSYWLRYGDNVGTSRSLATVYYACKFKLVACYRLYPRPMLPLPPLHARLLNFGRLIVPAARSR